MTKMGQGMSDQGDGKKREQVGDIDDLPDNIKEMLQKGKDQAAKEN